MKIRKYLLFTIVLFGQKGSETSEGWVVPTLFSSSSSRKSVEKLDPMTGQVLETFPSVSAAAKSVGKAVATMSNTVRGKSHSHSCAGFMWRFKYRHDEDAIATSTAVEKLNLKSGKVLESFPSISHAAAMTDGATRSNIRKVLQGKNKSCAGFFWREKGSDTLPSLEARGLIKKPVEMICLKSGDVLDTFRSITEAANSVGVVGSAISSVATGRLRTAGGFFWRYKGSTTKIRPIRKYWRSRTVEKLCVESGEIVETFDSLTAAANAIKVSESSISDVLSGRCKSCRGFFWRYEGSTAVASPEALGSARRANATAAINRKVCPVEKLCLQSGEVLEEFESIRDAAVSIEGSPTGIRNVLRGSQKFCKGFFWRYSGSTQLPAVEPEMSPNPVEKLCLKSSNVIETYRSIADAANRSGASQVGIRRVIQGKQLTTNGYFWRFKGSKLLPAPSRPYVGSKPVEKVCQETGRVLETFESISQATRSFNGPSMAGVSSVLDGNGLPYKGFFWRLQGSTKLPPPRRRLARSVERLSPTGEILETYYSADEAAKSLGISSPGYIYDAASGKRKSCYGYHWRFEGSDEVPDGEVPQKQSSRRTSPCFCYLLSSLNPSYPYKTYIGYTVDPLRRLDEHNRVKAGGAKRTATARPWEIKVVIEGFPSHNTAQRLEYAWQHFEKSHMVRNVIGDKWARKLKRNRNMEGQLVMLKVLLIACPDLYESSSLKINFLNAQDTLHNRIR